MKTLEPLVKASLEAHGVSRESERVTEIAIEAERLVSGVSSATDRLDFQSEPGHYAALMARGGARG